MYSIELIILIKVPKVPKFGYFTNLLEVVKTGCSYMDSILVIISVKVPKVPKFGYYAIFYH